MKKIIFMIASLLMFVGCTTKKPVEANNENELINEQLMQDNMKESRRLPSGQTRSCSQATMTMHISPVCRCTKKMGSIAW